MDKKLITNVERQVVGKPRLTTIRPRGPRLLQSVWFFEILACFVHEVMPERHIPTTVR